MVIWVVKLPREGDKISYILGTNQHNRTIGFFFCELTQGQLQRWTEHSTLIFENLKPVEI